MGWIGALKKKGHPKKRGSSSQRMSFKGGVETVLCLSGKEKARTTTRDRDGRRQVIEKEIQLGKKLATVGLSRAE